MHTHPTIHPPSLDGVPKEWQQKIYAFLQSREIVLSALVLDLDEQLHYHASCLVLTKNRLLHLHQESIASYPVSFDVTLSLLDYTGIGRLVLKVREERASFWSFTHNQSPQALAFCQTFELARNAALNESSNNVIETNPLDNEPQIGDLNRAEVVMSDETENLAASTSSLFRLVRFAKPYKWKIAFGFLLMLISTAAVQIPPYLTIPLVDDVLAPLERGQAINQHLMTMYLGGLFLAAILGWVLGWAKTYVLALISERIAADMRSQSYEHLLKLSLDYFGAKRTGDLISRVGSESDKIAIYLSLNLTDFATDLVMLVMTAAILWYVDPVLALITIVPIPFIIWMMQFVRHRLREGFERIDRVWGEITSVLADTIPGIRVVKAFAQERREAKRFRESNQHNLMVNDRVNKLWSLFSPSVSFLTEVGLLIVWAFGIWSVAHHAITTGMLLAALTYIARFYSRLDSMSRIVSVTHRAGSAAKRIFDILDQKPTVPDPEKPVALAQVKGAIDIADMQFRYGSRTVNKGINLSIKPGEMIGLVGHSGSGKSTLVNLICRFYDVSEGSIKIDGVDIRDVAVSEYRKNIGLVLQEPFLFFGTIAENIVYGSPDASYEQIVQAARAAHAHEFILKLPLGYDSSVGERGQRLSGGERQRISIARALLINPKILILDEATSSVDSETEKEIQRALDNLVKGRTTIAIAHRLSTLQKADRLVVMDAGEIIETGCHEELIAKKGAYFQLHKAQERKEEFV